VARLAAAVVRAVVIVDLAGLAYLDCSSLGVLAGARERARRAGGDVMLARPRGAVARLLLTGRDKGVPGVSRCRRGGVQRRAGGDRDEPSFQHVASAPGRWLTPA
jgi:hypothetical protein